ncbi:hypothetical protein [Methanobrevibacter sp.]|uniref:hypothetical protein n=1 Tax=Methanobrevibacter sp. TaxID=66852 RepID=UPI0026E00C1A|nr:hypothetical protein [Methanobrevibacter sp.]MDO5859595.1 hypothetical protein [Methanobrevibacter sp.]
MVEKTIELTEEQFKKVELLEAQGIEVGDAIDMLFKFKEDVLVLSDNFIDQRLTKANEEKAVLEEKMNEIDEEIAIYSNLKDTALDVEEKQNILEQQYGDESKTYEIRAQDAKRKISWARDFFKF